MSQPASGVPDNPAPRVPPRAKRTILWYYAQCKGCQWGTQKISEAHVHVLSEGHEMIEQRHHRLEPPTE